VVSPVTLARWKLRGMTYPVEKVKKQGDDVLHFLGRMNPCHSHLQPLRRDFGLGCGDIS